MTLRNISKDLHIDDGTGQLFVTNNFMPIDINNPPSPEAVATQREVTRMKETQVLSVPTPLNGVTMNVIQYGELYNFWISGKATRGGYIPNNGKYYLATVEDFQMLNLYQGEPIGAVLFKTASTSGDSRSCNAYVDATGIYLDNNGTGTVNYFNTNDLLNFVQLVILTHPPEEV